MAPDDATRRTYLANERTYLAWWRTGLTCLAVSFGAGRIVPSLSHQTRWPYAVLGAGFAVLGVVFMSYGSRRRREVDAAISTGDYAPADDTVLGWLTGAGVALGVLLLVLIVIDA